MMLPPIGSEIAAAGIGLGIVGAVFFGFSLLHAPLILASHLLADPHAKTSAGRPGVQATPIDLAVAAGLQARVAVVCLLLAFVLQLLAILFPSGGGHWGVPIAVAIAFCESARRIGIRWIERNWSNFEEAVWASPRITVVVDRQAATGPGRRRARWREPLPIRILRRLFGPQWTSSDTPAPTPDEEDPLLEKRDAENNDT